MTLICHTILKIGYREQINCQKLIEEHNHKYYVLDKPTITDFEYDN